MSERLYLESCGDPMVTNTIQIALVLVSLVALAWPVDLKHRTFQNFRPLVIRIEISAAPKHQLPQPRIQASGAEAKYFYPVCALYYAATATIQNDFSNLSTFSTASSPTILDAYRKDDIIKKFIQNTSLRDRCE